MYNEVAGALRRGAEASGTVVGCAPPHLEARLSACILSTRDA